MRIKKGRAGLISVLEDESSPKRPRLFCVSCAFLRLNPALPVSDPGRGFLSTDDTDDTDVLRWSRSKKILTPSFSFSDLCASVTSVDKTQGFSARF